MSRKLSGSRLGRAAAVVIESLEDRQLFSALAASSPELAFNASIPGYPNGGLPSHVDTLTITNASSTRSRSAPARCRS